MKHYRPARAMRPTVTLAFMLALACWPLLSHAQYMWLDDKGLKQLSDQPPPASVPQHRILKQPRMAAAAAAANAGQPAADGDQATYAAQPKVKRPPTLAERNAAFAKRKTESEAAELKAAQEASRKATTAAHCAETRNTQAALAAGTRMAEFDPSGQRVFLTDAQRAERANINEKILANCPR